MMTIEQNQLNQNAMGGTELMMKRLYDSVDHDLLEEVQIIPSRVRELDPNKKHILYLHDLAQDPEVQHLKDGGWEEFDALVFVSHWQQSMYNAHLGIPYSAGYVIENAIEPLEIRKVREDDLVRLIYTSTPHRGLEILYPVFDHLSKIHKNIHLDVFSSFELYGWKQRDQPYQSLFNKLVDHPKITYHGAKDNDTVRRYLSESDIFAYPSIWQETSCLALIEAMSAGLTCVHSSLAALPETSLKLTNMYQHTEVLQAHANTFATVLDYALVLHNGRLSPNQSTKRLVDTIYGIDRFSFLWNTLLHNIISK